MKMVGIGGATDSSPGTDSARTFNGRSAVVALSSRAVVTEVVAAAVLLTVVVTLTHMA